jgi:hypothetical protein
MVCKSTNAQVMDQMSEVINEYGNNLNTTNESQNSFSVVSVLSSRYCGHLI